jgi:hypothetical protein
MSNIKDIRVLNERAIAVKLPDDTVSYGIGIALMYSGANYLAYNAKSHMCFDERVYLPKGSWSILGMSDKLSEDEWKKVVDYEINPMEDYFEGAKDYSKDSDNYLCDTATESSLSLLKSKGIEVPHLILVKNG